MARPFPRRFGVAVAVAVVLLGVLGAALVVLLGTLERPEPPVLHADAGLPEEMVTGRTYPATFVVDFPDSWPVEDAGADPGTTRALIAVLGHAGPPQAYDSDATLAEGSTSVSAWIYCSTGVLEAAGERVELDCDITAPDPGQLTIVLEAGEPGLSLGEPSSWNATRVFEHVVVDDA